MKFSKFTDMKKYVSFDFGMLSKFQYYTGIIFQAYTYGTGEPVVKRRTLQQSSNISGKPASIGFKASLSIISLWLCPDRRFHFRKKAPVILTYTEDNRRKAILEAQKLRNEGTAVALRREKEDC